MKVIGTGNKAEPALVKAIEEALGRGLDGLKPGFPADLDDWEVVMMAQGILGITVNGEVVGTVEIDELYIEIIEEEWTKKDKPFQQQFGGWPYWMARAISYTL